MEVSGARTVEIAGNVIERSYAQGIDVHGAKVNGMWGDVPFTRILIHHNKVWESLLNCNDYGGIETWQGGPFYVFNNISYNALGYRHWERYSGTDAVLWPCLLSRWFLQELSLQHHADPAKTAADGNAGDAGPRKSRFALESNAYGRNVFHDFAEMGVLEPSGRWLVSFADFKLALANNRSLLAGLGEVSATPPLREPAKGDFGRAEFHRREKAVRHARERRTDEAFLLPGSEVEPP